MNTPEKLSQKRALLLARTAAALQLDAEAVAALFAIQRRSSLRINQLKVEDELSLLAELATAGWSGVQSAFYEHGYSIAEGRSEVVNSAAAKDGRIFIQNQASWLPVLALAPQPGEKILDICAAPGGKASHVAELTDNQAELWVNDNSRTRLFKLRSNFSRLGARYTEQTMYGIDRLTHVLPLASFDKILLDTPCSGEGLIDISRDKDFEYWSLAQIKRLQQLQKKAIMNAWKLLKPGGTLVYSTCTMAPEENEAVVDYLLTHTEDAELLPLPYTLPNRFPALQQWNTKTFKSDLRNCLRLAPSELTEAFFVATLTKSSRQVRYTDSNE
ncbi:MAG: RsmB/NOP family class I SAM-dependent RNA methyltransferase [Patescibacteria group bacterium]|nr:RsmB/NOP family class I SAM-dependent RNA methyltransferase [Patescibacteria group bacterium]